MTALAIEMQALTKVFPGGVSALSGLDMQVEPGSVFGLIGRNGAGKTTALRVLMGLLTPTAGRCRVLGEDFARAAPAHRARAAYVPQTQQLPAWMTLDELGGYVSHFYPRWDAAYASSLARRFDLDIRRPVGLLSGGQQRRAAVALAFAARPEVLILDEPAAGLDPVARRELIDEIVALLAGGEGCTVLLSTHIISDLERVADRVGIMDGGRLISQERLDELQTTMRRVQVIFPSEQAPAGFRIPGSLRAWTQGPVVTAIARIESPAVLDELRRQGLRVSEFPLGLEELFVELMGTTHERGESA